MDFTAPYPHSLCLTVHSPNAKYLASFQQTRESTGRLHPSSRTWDPRQDDAGQGRVLIRIAATMKLMRVISVTFNREGMRGINELAWSPDARMLLAVCQQTGVILVWSLDDEDFKARIDPLGVSIPVLGRGQGSKHRKSPSTGSLSAPPSPGRASTQLLLQQQASKGEMMPRGTRFGPDSRTVLVWEEYLARLVIWDLDWSHQARILQGVKPMSSTAALVGMTKGSNSWPKSCATTRSNEVEPHALAGAIPRHLPPPPLTLQSGTTSMVTFAHALHRDGRYLAIIERSSVECKDSLTIYRVPHPGDAARPTTTLTTFAAYPGNMWHKARSFPIRELVDVEGVVWSPDGRYLALWEKPSLGYKAAIYTMDGCCLGTFQPPEDDCSGREDGMKVGHDDPYRAPQPLRARMLMGIKTVCWHPSSKLLAVGGYDNKIRILHHLTWNSVSEMQHSSTAHFGDSTTLWRESTSNTMHSECESGVEYIAVVQPAPLPYNRSDPLKPNPKLGIHWCEFNADGSLLASRSDSMPTVIWIWSLESLLPIAVIQQQTPVRSCRWDPLNARRLIWCCGTQRVYCWRADQTPRGHTVDIIEVPAENFAVLALRWSPDGRGLLLLDKDNFCLAFAVDPDDTAQYTFVL